MAERETKDREKREEAGRHRKAQQAYDQLKQGAGPEGSQEEQVLAEMPVTGQASLVRNPQVYGAQRAEAMLGLQQTHGNRYVQRVMGKVQAKLIVNQLDDQCEKEADRVAEAVTNTATVQRQAAPTEPAASATASAGTSATTTTAAKPVAAATGVPKELTDHLKLREGWREAVYLDSKGFPTAGIGHLLTEPEKKQYKVGDKVPAATLEAWTQADAKNAYAAATAQASTLGISDSSFINALASVNFQLGTKWNSIHKKTWAHMVAHEWEKAALEVQGSSWYSQTHVRVQDFQAALRALIGTSATAPTTKATTTPSSSPASTLQPKLNRQASEDEEEKFQTKATDGGVPEVTQSMEERINAARSSGEAMPDSVRASFEPHFGRDLSEVRVHSDSEADDLSRNLGAKAFTTGKDIFFRSGDYQPYADEGKKLLGHEMTHVVQQQAVPAIQRQATGEAAIQRPSTLAAALQAHATRAAEEPTISYWPGADQSTVTAKALGIIKDILKKAGETSAIISSTKRTPADEARIMYDNLEDLGVASQRKLFAWPGQRVIDVYEEKKKAGKGKDEIISALKAKIDELVPCIYSHHCCDPTKLQVIDIAPSSIKDHAKFVKEVGKETRVSKFFQPPNDPAYHLEMPE